MIGHRLHPFVRELPDGSALLYGGVMHDNVWWRPVATLWLFNATTRNMTWLWGIDNSSFRTIQETGGAPARAYGGRLVPLDDGLSAICGGLGYGFDSYSSYFDGTPIDSFFHSLP